MLKVVVKVVLLITFSLGLFIYFTGEKPLPEGDNSEQGTGAKSAKTNARKKDHQAGSENSPHFGTIANPSGMDGEQKGDSEINPDDALERLSGFAQKDQPRALSFLRWCIFRSNFTAAVKEELLTEALTKFTLQNAAHISQDILDRKSSPGLYRRALEIQTKGLNPQNSERLIQSIRRHNTDPALKEILIEFATVNGINISD